MSGGRPKAGPHATPRCCYYSTSVPRLPRQSDANSSKSPWPDDCRGLALGWLPPRRKSVTPAEGTPRVTSRVWEGSPKRPIARFGSPTQAGVQPTSDMRTCPRIGRDRRSRDVWIPAQRWLLSWPVSATASKPQQALRIVLLSGWRAVTKLPVMMPAGRIGCLSGTRSLERSVSCPQRVPDLQATSSASRTKWTFASMRSAGESGAAIVTILPRLLGSHGSAGSAFT
jgi:hypothetical protein